MCEFEPLAPPEETDEGKWVVTVQSEEYRQLFPDIIIREGNYFDDGNNYMTAFFDNKQSAQYAAELYYISYGFDYTADSSCQAEHNQVTSQVMVF